MNHLLYPALFLLTTSTVNRHRPGLSKHLVNIPCCRSYGIMDITSIPKYNQPKDSLWTRGIAGLKEPTQKSSFSKPGQKSRRLRPGLSRRTKW